MYIHCHKCGNGALAVRLIETQDDHKKGILLTCENCQTDVLTLTDMDAFVKNIESRKPKCDCCQGEHEGEEPSKKQGKVEDGGFSATYN